MVSFDTTEGKTLTYQLSICSTRPSPQIFDHLVRIYASVIHLQPLPLFQPEHLRERLPCCPQFLRWTFFALALAFSEGYISPEEDAQTGEFYASKADEVMQLAMEGNCSLPVIQALCLLVLLDMKCKETVQSNRWANAEKDRSLQAPERLDQDWVGFETSNTSDTYLC